AFTDHQLAAAFFEQQPQPAFWMTPIINTEKQVVDFEYRYCNQAFYQYTGLTPDIVIGNRLSSSPAISSLVVREKIFSELLDVYQNGYQPKKWINNTHLNKNYSYTRNRVEGGVLTVMHDGAEEYKMMQQLEEQQQLTDSILTQSSNAITVGEMIRNESGKIIDIKAILVNEAAVRSTGIPKEVYLQKTGGELDPAFVGSPYFDLCVRCMETGEPAITQYYLEPADRWIEVSISKMDAEHQIYIFSDVTSIKQAQIRVEQAAERLSAVFNASQSGMFIFSPVINEKNEVIDFRFVITNPSFAAYVGQTPDTLKGELGSKWFPGYLTNGVFDMYKKTYITGETLRRDVHYHVDQHDLYLDLLSTKVQDEVLVTFTDYTNIKKAQLQLQTLVEELRQSNIKLEEFAHAASHDLKEPIRKMHVFSDRLKSSLGDRMNSHELRMFDRMQDANERMTNLVDDLLTYSQVSMTEYDMEEVDLSEKIQVVLADLELLVEEKNAKIDVMPLPVVKGYRRQLQQLFQNLVSNALKYCKEGIIPEIVIQSSVVTGDETPFDLESNKRFHLIQVIDNGIGFEQQYEERIFQMFQRLHGKAEYPGSGIGLAIVRKVAENHHGAVWAKSKPRLGSTFNVLLPIE
ncbi:MAG: PAS domain-containing protein, partial [Chitinophagaceae bacterium]